MDASVEQLKRKEEGAIGGAWRVCVCIGKREREEWGKRERERVYV